MIDVERGPEPPALARGLRDPELRLHLHRSFLGKCYLTEQSIDATGMDVDHRQPKADGGTDAWTNLFPSHPKVNAHRARKTPSGGYLSPGEQVEIRLVQQLETCARGVRCTFAAAEEDDLPAHNTARELRMLHHEVQDGSLDWSRDLREAIHTQLTEVLLLFYQLHDEPHNAQLIQEKLRCLLSRRAPFTALLRSKVPHLHRLFD